MLRRRTAERSFDILDSRSVFGWIKYQLKPPNKKKIILAEYKETMSDNNIYPSVLSYCHNPIRIAITECEFCHKTHSLKMFFNGVIWQQVKNDTCPYSEKRKHLLPNYQHSPIKMIPPNKKIVSIITSKSSNDMDYNTRLNDIKFIQLSGEHPIANPNQKWAETRNNNNKNTHPLGLLHNVIHGIRDVTSKQTYNVKFNTIVTVKTIPGRYHYTQRHVTFTPHVIVYTIPANKANYIQKII